jgi:aminopeptidase N
VEDVTLFERDRQRTIALYPSPERVSARGTSYNEDDYRDFDVLDYDIDATVSPQREFIEGRARLRLRAHATALSSLTLRLADTLTVTSVTSPEYGRLLHLRVRGQNTIIVSLPVEMEQDSEMTIVVSYSGSVEPQAVEDEAAQSGEGSDPTLVLEPNLLWSNRSYWYPQSSVSDYATATMRITVPEGYTCVASGDPRRENEVTLRDLLTLGDGKVFVFTAREPLRYLALVVSRFVRVAESTIEITARDEPLGQRTMRLAIEANPRQQGLGRSLLGDFQAIMRFYASTLGDAPYESATLALVEHELPGGHSPGYFALLNSTPPGARLVWRSDPAAFGNFPEFFLAHELAHQWWGQAVGWRNYHEQWLSEGFAQYFAALYARQVRGERVFGDMLRQFNRWAIAESDEGPVNLGYRLGHIRAQPRVFRAVVYNKGAAVLHMLRRLVGDETFFVALRRFYMEQKFQKADTEALRRTFEEESSRSLGRFFDRWIYGADLPRVRFSRTIDTGSVTVRFEQTTEQIFDIPVTVTITYANGRTHEAVVALTERTVEWTSPTNGLVRQVQVNRDYAAVARFDAE